MPPTSQSAQFSQPVDGDRSRRAEALRSLVLGINAWMVLLVLPMAFASPRSVGALTWLLLPLPPLFLGVSALYRARTDRLASWTLLAVFPAVTTALMALLPQLVSQPPYNEWVLLLGAASLLAFGAGAALGAGRPAALRTTTHRPLGSTAQVDDNRRQRWLRRALLAVVAVGAFLLAVVAPSLGGVRTYRPAWDAGAAEASTLTAVVGGALASVAIAMVVGPSLRAPRGRPPSARRVRRRVVGLLLSVAFGALLFVLYQIELND